MQPLKWRMTYKYRIQDIKPVKKVYEKRSSALDPGIPAVGKGILELWMVGPRSGDEIRSVKLISASTEPIVKRDERSGVDFYYLDMAPDGYLPQECQAELSWEFISFERYTFWDGVARGAYDKNSQLYKQYTREEHPFIFHPGLLKEIKKATKDCEPDDFQAQAAACYNHLISNLSYDYEELGHKPSQSKMIDAWRTWENRSGQCDEFTNVYVTMLRSLGIPARPVAGLVHWVNAQQQLECGAHAWAEYYLPNVGWVPVDPTWGGQSQVIDPISSILGNRRQIPVVDYYYGKSDPFRLTLFKNWNYTLQPAPHDPEAEKTETWFVGYTERFDGIKDYMAAYPDGGCFDICIELVGPASKEEAAAAIKEIEAEGGNYVNVPAIPGEYPMQTLGGSAI